ncbi:MAG: hypothetical protein U0527_14075 [Candidatus Eisenbacteria bacterium]
MAPRQFYANYLYPNSGGSTSRLASTRRSPAIAIDFYTGDLHQTEIRPTCGSMPTPTRARPRWSGARSPTAVSTPVARCAQIRRRGTTRPDPARVEWDGKDDHGSPVPSGIYFVRLTAGRLAKTMRVVITR